MHALASVRVSRILTYIISPLLLVGCFGEGDGQQRILNQAAPPEPPLPEGFCDPIGFEDVCEQVADIIPFEGGVVTIESTDEAPPGVAAGNDSAKVARMLKFRAESGETFGGSTIILNTPLEVSAGSSFTMRVWAQRAVNVLFQPEPQGPGSGVEVTHGGTGWEEMTFPLPAVSGTVSGITLIFDNGILGDADNDPEECTNTAPGE